MHKIDQAQLPTVRQSSLLSASKGPLLGKQRQSGMHPRVPAYMYPTAAYLHPSVAAYMHPKSAYMYPRVSAYMYPTSKSFYKMKMLHRLFTLGGNKLIVWSLRSIWAYRLIQNIIQRSESREKIEITVLQ